ncbi:MAG TPA: hypothetical protein VNE71_03335 [Myxococcota bacterium]|nr:hypothetical protein [Myxococcota bacterium]
MRLPVLLLALAALLLVSDGTAETRVFESGDWEVWCAGDSGAAPRYMAVSVGGGSPRQCSELKIRRQLAGHGEPQLFSVKGIGALRPALPPPGAFGATFYASGYWDCALGLRQTLAIESLDVALDPDRTDTLRLGGRAANAPTLAAPDFTLRLAPPDAAGVLRAEVAYTLVATADVCVRPAKQELREGFRIARAASNYLSPATHDSDALRFADASGAVCEPLRNREDFAIRSPRPLADPTLALVHETAAPRPTPTVAIRFLEPPADEVSPQGYVTGTWDPDADNIDVWGNWDRARAWRAGERIGRFAYVLEASPPAPAGCR